MNKIIPIVCLLLCLAFGSAAVRAEAVDANQAEQSAKRADPKGNSFASTQVYPAGTRFPITEIHPASSWYSYFYSPFYGKSATAVDCSSGINNGIEYEDSGSRIGYYSACFYLDGDSTEYFVYGFKFSLLSTTTPTPVGSSTPTATYSNGTLVLKRMAMDDGAAGTTYYDVVLTLVLSSSPLAFTVDSVVQSK